MLALAVGAAFPAAQAMAATTPPAAVQVVSTPATDASDTARSANAQPAPLDDATAQQILGQMPGIKDPSFGGGFGRFFGNRFTPASAVQKLNRGQEVQVPNGGQTDSIRSKDQLASLAVMRGLYPNSGVAPGIVHAFQNGSFSENGRSLDAYQAYDAVRHGTSVTDTVGGRGYGISTPAQAQELNALEGNGQDNPLNPATSSLLKKMAEGTPGEGIVSNGAHLNAYEALQALEGHQATAYTFSGGPYNAGLSVPLQGLQDLGRASDTAANQHAADAVRPSMAFFQGQMAKLVPQVPAGVDADIKAAQGLIQGGQADEQRYTAAAQQESQVLPGLSQAVDTAQANLNATMPDYQAASQRLAAARQNLDYASSQVDSARRDEAGALAANQSAQSDLANAKARIQQAQSTIDAQAPSDPFAQKSAPADPFASKSASAPADPFAKSTGSASAPSDPFASSNNAGSNNAAAQVRAQAQADKAQAQSDAAQASRQVNYTYGVWQQYHQARIAAENQLAGAQADYDQAAAVYNQADGVRGQAAGVLQDAQAQLSAHQAALADDQAAAGRAQQQIQQGTAALDQAQKLKTAAGQYISTVSTIGDPAALDAHQKDLQDSLHQLATLAANPDLQASIAKQQTLLHTMTRPLPAKGYVEPSPVVISEQ